MLDKLMKLFSNDSSGEPDIVRSSEFGDSETRLAAAALLIHASRIDGEVTPDERQSMNDLLTSQFGLTENEISKLISNADDVEKDAVDLYQFTSVLTRHLDQDGRKKIVAMLWGVVFADGKIHEFEDNLVWRVAELIGVSTRDRMILKKQARADAS